MKIGFRILILAVALMAVGMLRAQSDNTGCALITNAELPYSMDFDNVTSQTDETDLYGLLPDCWHLVQMDVSTSEANYPRLKYSLNASDHTSGRYSLYMNRRGLVSLPAVASNVRTIQLDMQVRQPSSGYMLAVGVMSDTADASTFVPVDTINCASTAFEPVTVYFSNYTGNGHYIALRNIGSSSRSENYIDDLVLNEIITCFPVHNLLSVDIDTASAVIGWTRHDAMQSNFLVACGTGSDPDQMTSFAVTDTTITLTGLLPGTAYHVFVKTVCDSTDQSRWSDELTFATMCTRTAVPYAEGFEAYEGAAYNAASGVVPNCWEHHTSGMVPPHVVDDGSNYAYIHGGSHALSFYGLGNSYAALPLLTADLNTLQVGFWMQTDHDSYGTLTLGYLAEDDSSFDSYSVIATFPNSYGAMTWQEVMLSSLPADAARLAFCWTDASLFAHSCCIDDITVEPLPTCIRPTRVMVGGITDTSAVISWNACTDSGSYLVKYSELDSVVVADTMVAIAGLAGNMTYMVRVKTLCGATGQSAWSDTETFSTLCHCYELPYYEDFEDVAVDAVVPCWNNGISTASAMGNNAYYIWGVYDYGGNGMMRMCNSHISAGIAAVNTPQIVLPEGSRSQLKFDYAHNASCGNFALRISTDGGSTFSYLASYSKGTGSSDTDPGAFTSAALDLSDYAGETVMIQFYSYVSSANYGSGAIFIDNIVVRDAPECLEPSNLVADGITPSSVTIRWIAHSDSGRFIVKYGENDSVVVCDTTVVLTGLTPATSYEMSVRALCTDTLQSAWSSILPVRTPAIPATVPYYCGFEDSAENLNWIYVAGSGINHFIIGTEVDAVYEGSHALYVSDTTGVYTYATNSATKTYAYRSVLLDAGSYFAHFDWSCSGGENGYDFGSVMIVPVDEDLIGGSGTSYTTTTWPRYTARLDYSADTPYYCRKEGWNDFRGGFTVSDSGLYNIAVLWNNDGGLGTDFPFAIDNFGIQQACQLSAVASNDTMGEVSGSGIYGLGDTVVIVAEAKAGYRFVDWNDGDTQATRQIVIVGDTSFTANFVTVYAISALASPTHMGTISGSGDYMMGDTVVLSAASSDAARYEFLGWEDGDTSPVRHIVVGGAAAYVAYFGCKAVEVELAVNDTTLGTTVPVPGIYAFHVGDTLSVAAQPARHGIFDHWEVRLPSGSSFVEQQPSLVRVFDSTDAGCTYEVVGYFVSEEQFEVILSVKDTMGRENIGGTVSGAGCYYEGDQVTVAAQADEDYTFVAWYDMDGVLVDYRSSYAFFMEDEAVALVALFSCNNVGIIAATAGDAVISSRENLIVVQGAVQQCVYVYDVVGRLVGRVNHASDEQTFVVGRSGIYLVRIGNNAARRIWVQ